MEEKEFVANGRSNCNKKKKIIYIIAISLTALLIIAIIFLIGHLKFNWFKKVDDEDDNDIYNLNVKIKSSANQVDYFSEEKKIKSKVVYTSGKSDEQEQIVDTNFAVFIVDKTEDVNNENKRTIYMNNAILVILDSKVKYREKEIKLNSFDIFDEKQIKEFESNPNGTIYPMAKFSYFENGTIIDINLPENMDQYNAQSMIELINNVVPKLSRNKKADKKKGLTVTEKKTENGDILTEIQAPKEYKDKFTNEEYKGSIFEKKTEVDVENEKIKKVLTNSNLILETQKENEDTLDFGLQNFTYDIASDIKSTKNEENKLENVQLVKKLAEKLKFIKSDDLIKSLLKQEKDSQLDETLEEDEDFKKIIIKGENETKEEKSEIKLNNSKQRKLKWEGSKYLSWTLATLNILGKTISLKYEISLSDGELSNTLSVSCGKIKLSYGNTGTTTNTNKSKKKTVDKELFYLLFPGPLPIPITFSFLVGGSIGYDVDYNPYSDKFSISLTGELYANAEVSTGAHRLAKLGFGAQGTIISITAETTLTKNNNKYSCSSSIDISGGKITCYVSGTLLNQDIFYVSYDFLDGWTDRLS